MKCVTKLFCLAGMISSTTMGCATELPSWRATPARRAQADGAIVTLQVHVVDETGAPVEDAYVGVGFWAPRGPESIDCMGRDFLVIASYRQNLGIGFRTYGLASPLWGGKS